MNKSSVLDRFSQYPWKLLIRGQHWFRSLSVDCLSTEWSEFIVNRLDINEKSTVRIFNLQMEGTDVDLQQTSHAPSRNIQKWLPPKWDGREPHPSSASGPSILWVVINYDQEIKSICFFLLVFILSIDLWVHNLFFNDKFVGIWQHA